MESKNFLPIAVLGAGSWGTALALCLARLGQEVRLWTIETDHADTMINERTNARYMPGFDFPPSLLVKKDLGEAINNIKDILVAIPSAGFRSTLLLLKPLISKNVCLLGATKGLDEVTGQLLHQVVAEIFGKQQTYAVLAGPSFAREVAAGLPTAVAVASNNSSFVKDITARFNQRSFRVYHSNDIIGLEIGSVVKNVLAIATGISDGMGFGANARCALITRGLAEMIRLGIALGAHADTFTGLAGVGDLVLTCTDDQSRNRRFGLALGRGEKKQQAANAIDQVIEGKRNAELVIQLAKQHHIEMPICEMVWNVVAEKLTAQQAVENLLAREPGEDS